MSMEPDKLLLAIVAVCLKKRAIERRKRKRSIWMKECHSRRAALSNKALLDELKVSSPNDFRNVLPMDSTAYEELLNMITPLIKKQDTVMREAIPANVRFAATLHFLATGDSFTKLTAASAISESSLSKIVFETCEAIIACLKAYIKLPTTPEEWRLNADDFYTRCNFPHCLGVVAGKHVPIKKPYATDGSPYYNYKKYFSVALTAVVNANYEFMTIDVGYASTIAEITRNTPFGKALQDMRLNIPTASLVSHSEIVLPYVFAGVDHAELMDSYVEPFPQPETTSAQQLFNERLNCALEVAENAFGVLFTRFGVFQKPINLAPEKVRAVVLACCYLHNFLCAKMRDEYTNGMVDHVDEHLDVLVCGAWRDIFGELTPLQRGKFVRDSSENANAVRAQFVDHLWNAEQIDLEPYSVIVKEESELLIEESSSTSKEVIEG